MNQSAQRRLPFSLITVIAFVVVYLVARGMLEVVTGSTLRTLVAILPVIPFSLWLFAFVSDLRTADELERRIHLEALAIAFPLALILFMTLGLLEIAITLPPEDLSYRHTWIALPLFYFGGLTIARRRYA